MTSERIRIETANDEATEHEAGNREHSPFRFAGVELEHRITPLVVIAIIAILIGLLVAPSI